MICVGGLKVDESAGRGSRWAARLCADVQPLSSKLHAAFFGLNFPAFHPRQTRHTVTLILSYLARCTDKPRRHFLDTKLFDLAGSLSGRGRWECRTGGSERGPFCEWACATHTHKHMHMGLGDMRGTTEPIRSTRCHLILDRVWLLVISQSARRGNC